MSRELAITISQLSKTFNGREVIHQCNMTVEKGTIYGFLGKNGAGKTTIFKMILGLMAPTFGKATVFEMDSVKDNLEILRKTGSLIETPVFYEHLSATENLKMHMEYMGGRSRDMEEALQMVGLSYVGEQSVSTFSMGMRQRLAIARALVHRPELLILDEPINGLDPEGIRDMRKLFCYLVKEEKMTILLSSHILSEIEQVANRIGFIVNGTIVEETTPDEIKDKHSLGIEDYFMKITKGGRSYE